MIYSASDHEYDLAVASSDHVPRVSRRDHEQPSSRTDPKIEDHRPAHCWLPVSQLSHSALLQQGKGNISPHESSCARSAGTHAEVAFFSRLHNFSASIGS